MFGASFLPLNDSMPSIQAAKYVREDMHSIKAPIKAGHVFQKLWECSCGSVNKFEENVYLLCLTLQPCTLNLRPRQIHYTAGVWQMKPSLVSPKASQSKTAAFFFLANETSSWRSESLFLPACLLQMHGLMMKFLPCQLQKGWEDFVPSLKDTLTRVSENFFVLFSFLFSLLF